MSAGKHSAMRRVQRSRQRPWYVYDSEAADDEASGELVIASCRSQAAALWRQHYGLSARDLGEDQLSVEPAVWDRPGEPEPAWPREPRLWFPPEKVFRGYGLHYAGDCLCDGCGEWVDSTDDEELCPECAEQEEAP